MNGRAGNARGSNMVKLRDRVAGPSRFAGRTRVVLTALGRRVSTASRRPPRDPRRILIAHHLLLGDTLMLTPLLAKLRARYPQAEIVMTVAGSFAPLYTSHPYGV